MHTSERNLIPYFGKEMWMQDIWEGSNLVLNIKHPCSRERDAFRGQSFKLFLLRNLRLAGIRKVLTGGFSWLWNEISSLLKNAPETLGPYLLEPPPRVGLGGNLFGICCPFLLFKITNMATFFVQFSFPFDDWRGTWYLKSCSFYESYGSVLLKCERCFGFSCISPYLPANVLRLSAFQAHLGSNKCCYNKPILCHIVNWHLKVSTI